MTAEVTQILTRVQVEQKIRRIAFEIYENNFEQSEVILAGVSGEGHVLAQRLAEVLQQIAPLNVRVMKIMLDKTTRQQPAIHLDADEAVFTDKPVVVVDDVLNSGRTLAFALQPFLNVPLISLKVAVIVDRDHKRYPIAADYIGYKLSTTLTEHVQVVLSDEEKIGVYMR
ncbi:phosphoribosyltransferase family protein [Larkinella terrae]|uniref:Phosphoribosyltransferase n=1 Tax=Larkinella terrae TaxID=2025311 RepID=A0A7K0ENS3_9BACT|nr:phosphoribosyltransferase family protein [Larkinella terrae]MRS63118.1 phosphoribosyltransferase [Larkinella terrae]